MVEETKEEKHRRKRRELIAKLWIAKNRRPAQVFDQETGV